MLVLRWSAVMVALWGRGADSTTTVAEDEDG